MILGLLTASLLFITGCIHHFIGGRKIWRPMLIMWENNQQNKLVKGTIGFIWYGVTAWFVAMTLLVMIASIYDFYAKGVLLCVCLMTFSFAISASLYGKLVYGRYLSSPQWLFFWPISIMAFLAFISY